MMPSDITNGIVSEDGLDHIAETLHEFLDDRKWDQEAVPTTLGDYVEARGGVVRGGYSGKTLEQGVHSLVGGVPVLLCSALVNGGISPRPVTLPMMSPGQVRRSSQYLVRTDDILMGRQGSQATGNVAVVTERNDGHAFGNSLILIRLPIGEDPHMLAALMENAKCQQWLRDQTEGRLSADVNQEIVRNIPLVIPPPDRGEVIAALRRLIVHRAHDHLLVQHVLDQVLGSLQ